VKAATVSPVIHAIDERHVVATWDRVFLLLWRGDATAEAVENMARVAAAWVREQEMGTSTVLSVIESRSPPPNDRVRPLLMAFYRDLAPMMRRPLIVAEGSGFRGALVRGVGTAVSALAPSLLPFQFPASVNDAAAIIAPSLSPRSGGVTALVEAVGYIRGRLDQLSPS
jgi:hypothetical protein